MPNEPNKKSSRNKRKRSHHFLPICYQKAFTGADGQVWVRYLDQDKPRPLNPISVGKTTEFYTRIIKGVKDASMEEFFGVQVEGSYAPIAVRLKQDGIDFKLLREDIPSLLKFVASQVVRTEAHRRWVNQQAGIKVDSRIFVRNIAQKMHTILGAWRSVVPDVILYRSVTIGSLFITGDDPVVPLSNDTEKRIETPFDVQSITDIGTFLKRPYSSFLLPLSPYFSVAVVNDRTGTVTSLPEDRDPVWVSKVNELICIQAVRLLKREMNRLWLAAARKQTNGSLVQTL